MVLLRDTRAPVWGWDEPGTTITVSFRGQVRTSVAAGDGSWRVQIPTGEAGGPFSMEVKGTRESVFEDVLVGEVWLAGGQSNMWQHQGVCKDAEKEREDADYPLIRYWDANTSTNQGGWMAESPQRTVKAAWQAATKDSVAEFAAVPFFFARELHRKLGVPVGIVHTAVPSAPIEAFLSPDGVASHRAYVGENLRAAPSALYNGMVAPAAPYAVRGMLWWQGEANANRAEQYRTLFPALVKDWRKAWNAPAAPFLFVELANFLQLQTRPVEDDQWPALRDAQLSALALENVWEVSAIDAIGPDESPMNIHPPHKQLVAHRLYRAAMANVYDDPALAWSGPRFRAMAVNGSEVTVTFDCANEGLGTVRDEALRGFAIAGADQRFVWAEARWIGDSVLLCSRDVPQPVAVRYGWANNPVGNLCGTSGLPAFPFRTDKWPLCAKKEP